MNPKFLFCDEPNSGLDPQTSILIDGLIEQLTSELNMTTVVITHDMNSVMEIGDSIIFIYEGKKWWEGNRESIITTDNPEISNFVYASDFMKEIRSSMQEKRR
jgi:phospholipid/cholesterol/gamma-HCH transport system ATP-binding protein